MDNVLCLKSNPKLRKVLKKRVPPVLFYIIVTITLLCLSYVVLYPVISVVSLAFRPASEMFDETVIWISKRPTFVNIKDAVEMLDYWAVLFRTIIAALVCSVLQMTTCSMGAYGLSRFKFKGKNFLFLMVVLTIVVPPQTAQIPNFINMRYFDFFGIGRVIGLFTGEKFFVSLINTQWSIIIPSLFASGLQAGLYIFIFRQFFLSIPKSLEEAAKIDGCNAAQTFIRIIVPNNIPVYVVVFLLSFVEYWNDTTVTSLYLINKDSNFIMHAIKGVINNAYGLTSLYNYGQNDVIFSAMALLAIIPPILLYVLCQRKFTEFLDRSGMKG